MHVVGEYADAALDVTLKSRLAIGVVASVVYSGDEYASAPARGFCNLQSAHVSAVQNSTSLICMSLSAASSAKSTCSRCSVASISASKLAFSYAY